jgi:hypothetical protein
MFSVGDLVICIIEKDSWWPGGGIPENPDNGKIYTVRSVFMGYNGFEDVETLRLQEIKDNVITKNGERGWGAIYFRKVLDYRETMKKKQEIKEPV